MICPICRGTGLGRQDARGLTPVCYRCGGAGHIRSDEESEDELEEIVAERDGYRDAKTLQLPAGEGDHTEEEFARIQARYHAGLALGASHIQRAYSQAFDEMSAVFQQAREAGPRREDAS